MNSSTASQTARGGRNPPIYPEEVAKVQKISAEDPGKREKQARAIRAASRVAVGVFPNLGRLGRLAFHTRSLQGKSGREARSRRETKRVRLAEEGKRRTP